MTPDDSYETPFPTDSETGADGAPQAGETDTGSTPKNSASENLAHPEDVAEADAAEDAWNKSDSDTESETLEADEGHNTRGTRAVEAGMDMFMRKPFTIDRYNEVLDELDGRC